MNRRDFFGMFGVMAALGIKPGILAPAALAIAPGVEAPTEHIRIVSPRDKWRARFGLYDSNRIQRALDSLHQGGTVYLKEGSYFLDKTVFFRGNRLTVVAGGGAAFFMADELDGPMFS